MKRKRFGLKPQAVDKNLSPKKMQLKLAEKF
jgi:hypothetical protein